jgi:hypothetical protein
LLDDSKADVALTDKEQEYKAYLNLQKQMEMDFNPDEKSHEELREHFKVSSDKNPIAHMNEQMFE